MFLCGRSTTSLDAKNRIRLPARFKAIMGDKYILLPGMGGCIYVIKEDEPQAILDIISSSESADPEKEEILRNLVSEGCNVEADSQGRFTLPVNLIEYANIDDSVEVVGNISKVEIWSSSNWANRKIDRTPVGINNMYSALNKSKTN